MSGLFSRPVRSVKALYYGSPLYRLTLLGRAPDQVLQAPTDPWPGEAARGRAMTDGIWRLAGQTLQFDPRDDAPEWYPDAAWTGWLEEIHGFTWLRDLREAGGDSRQTARHAVAGWMADCGSWDRFAWRADILGRRLVAWTTHSGFLLNGADALFRRRFLQSLAEQTRHLARVVNAGPEGLGRIGAVKALLYAGLTLPGAEKRFAQAMRLLEHELNRQMLPDGGQRERNPSVQFLLMRDLVDVRLALIQAKKPVPDWLQQTIDRAAPMLRFYRHGDGALALFNGGTEESAELIDNVLAMGQATGKPVSRAQHTGYERLSARKTLILADAGGPPASDYAAHAHAAPLAFEMSIGPERLIVNMGAWQGADASWRTAVRETAAHSTMAADDENAVEIRRDGSLGRAPRNVTVERDEEDGAVLLTLSHDGYRPLGRLVHRRSLYLSATGEDVRGEDVLEGPGGTKFALRFHLHPDVQAAVVRDGQGALLRLPSGEGWRMRMSGGVLELTDSVYLGTGQMKRSQQVVISGGLNGESTVVKWALTRVPPPVKKTRRRVKAEDAVPVLD
ncbi:MAG: heparinase II/III family protein [Rhodospirillales bacterium]|nr:heparinase II/III family protein [Rhodospirillales bacterium]